ncbi:MAG: iron chaperone [Flavobacteriales bacterium]
MIPDANIGIRYNMPAFYDEGVVVCYAAYKNQMGLYPTAFPIECLKDRLVQYKTSKGAIQFPYDKLPKELIQQIIQVRLAQMKNKRTK